VSEPATGGHCKADKSWFLRNKNNRESEYRKVAERWRVRLSRLTSIAITTGLFVISTYSELTPAILAASGQATSLALNCAQMSTPKRSLLQRFKDFDIANVFTPKLPPSAPRTVYINAPLPDSFYVHKRGKRKVRKDARYATNQVVTSKYTILTFLPRNLLEQFRRIANM
jgi:hypothetical protein